VASDASEPIAGPARRDASTGTFPLALLVLAAALALVHLALPLASLVRLVPLNYNEGWNAYHAEAVFSERPLYPGSGALFPNNYPPLSFALIASLARALGDPILVGRLLSLAAVLAIAAEIGWLARRESGSARIGAFAGLAFVAILGAAFGEYVGMNDPQLMAHALLLGGLVLIARGRSAPRLWGAALLMVLGGLVKHNLVALPLAVTLWLFGRDRQAFERWLLAAAGVGLGALALLGLGFGAAFFESLTGPREISLLRAAETSAEYLGRLSAPLAVALLALREAWRDRDARLLVLYAALSLALGVAFSVGEGVSYNVYFDLAIALVLLGGFLLARVPETFRARALGLALLIGPLLGAPYALLGLGPGLELLARLDDATRRDVDYLSASGEPVLCETLALCFWAGKPPSVDLFNSRQAFRAGLADEEQLLGRIARGEFAVVQLASLTRERDDERVSRQLTGELERHYVVDRVSANGVFLRPRARRGGP